MTANPLALLQLFDRERAIVTIRFELKRQSSLSAHRQPSLDQKPLGLRGDRKLLVRSVIVKYLRDARPAPAGSWLGTGNYGDIGAHRMVRLPTEKEMPMRGGWNMWRT